MIHKPSKTFKNTKYKTDTELSIEIWKLKKQNNNLDMSRVILGTHQSYSTTTKQHMLCLNEKLATALHKRHNILNKRTGITSKFRQQQMQFGKF